MWFNDEYMSTDKIVAQVFQDMGKKSASKLQIKKEESVPCGRSDRTKKLWNDNPGAFFSVFEYADDEGELVMEHGGIFDNLPGIRISKH